MRSVTHATISSSPMCALFVSSMQRPRNDLSWIQFLNTKIILYVTRAIRPTQHTTISFLVKVCQMYSTTIWFPLNLKQQENLSVVFFKRLFSPALVSSVLLWWSFKPMWDSPWETTTSWASPRLRRFDGFRNSLLKAFSFNCILCGSATLL